jgi:hypothetical protein
VARVKGERTQDQLIRGFVMMPRGLESIPRKWKANDRISAGGK